MPSSMYDQTKLLDKVRAKSNFLGFLQAGVATPVVMSTHGTLIE